MSFTIDFTVKESQKDKMIKENGLKKLIALEQKMRAVKGTSLYDPIKVAKICLVPNMVIPIKFTCQNLLNILEFNAL
jgi:hypothetical protein